MAEKENVITLTYDLLKYLVPVLKKYPRSQKFVLADRVQNTLTGILEMLIEAYYIERNQKGRILKKTNIELEKLRYLIRLSKDMYCVNMRRYEYIQARINAIGIQVGGWQKSVL